MPVGLKAVRQWFTRTFLGCFNREMSENQEDDSALEVVNSTPMKQTMDSLSKTPKGQLKYDREPLSPIMLTSLNSKSGILMPDSVFTREPSRTFEKSFVKETHFSEEIENTETDTQRNAGLPLKFIKSENRPNHLSWQEELLLMRNTQQFDETTPVYNVSNEMLMKLFECNEGQKLSVASNVQRRLQEIEATSRQHADEECLRKKRELEARLVPKTESHVEFELISQRLQEEAKHQRQQKEDQIDKKIKEIINQQERAQKERQQKQFLAQQVAEAEERKNVCSSKADTCWKIMHEMLCSCPEKEVFLQSTHTLVRRITDKKKELEHLLKYQGTSYLTVANTCDSLCKDIDENVSTLELEITKHREEVKTREVALKTKANSGVVTSPTPTMPKETKQALISDEAIQQKTEPKVKEEFQDCVFDDDLEFYSQLLQELHLYKVAAETFKNNPTSKGERFDLQKAVVQPINEISDQSGPHLQDKLDRLKNLLRRNSVNVGSKSTKISQNAGAFEFCINLLASKMVQQAEDQVNVNPKAAFPIAAVIVELWIEFPVFGRLVLAYFYKQCPFLVPFYIPQKENQTNEAYYKSLGYRYSAEGKVELQPAYLKRMCGIIRLYAAIIVYSPRNNQPHPHGLDVAWHFLSSFLNLPPRNDITSTILAEFLSVSGNALSKEFGRQFHKMLHFICTEYFTMIRNVTPEGSGGGPNARLEEFLQESIMKRGIPSPAGLLPPRFW